MAAFKPVWTESSASQYDAIKKAAQTAARTRAKTKQTKASKQEGLYKQVHKCIQHLLANPKHPSLQTHEYDSLEHPYTPGQKVFEAYAQNRTPGAYRLFWCYGPRKGEITLIAITPHP